MVKKFLTVVLVKSTFARSDAQWALRHSMPVRVRDWPDDREGLIT
ncbi:hypothetical protein [Mycolicibacterium confluentis]|nr:hypothetical protein [Mycolicibacterium confluentis]